MTKFLTILFIALLPHIVSAQTTYHVALDGSGDFTSIAQVNAATFAAGDNILFKRGDTFYGSIAVSNSGTSGNPITYGAYGTGTDPVITGFTTVSSWTNLGSNIWESTSAVSALSTCNMVSVNGKNTPMGRYPNSSFLTYQSHSGNTTITSASLTGTPDWTGADVVIKEGRYSFESGRITSQSGSTLTYTNGAVYPPEDGFGLFIQDDIRTLDQQNEWYYNPSTKKIDVYSATEPTNVKVASVNSVFTVSGNYIVIDGLDINGSNANLISVTGSHFTVQNSDLSYAGQDAINNTTSAYMTVDNNTLRYCNDNGVKLGSSSTNGVITNNSITSIGVIPGMTQIYSYGSISALGNNTLIQYNSIDSSGYNGVTFNGAGSKLKNNFINNSCLIKDDGGGIYIADGDISGREITGNIVLNTKGCIDGIDNSNYMGFGIYLDSYSSNILVSGNTVSGCGAAGGFFSNLDSNTIRSNTFYNNSLQGGFSAQSQVQFQHICCNNVRSNVFNDNIVFTKNTGKYNIFIYSSTDDISSYGTSDSNYYVNPTSINVFNTQVVSTITDRSFSNWKTYTGWDANSTSAKLDSAVNFQYNATGSAVTIPLDFKYKDAANNIYDGTITLQPYTSAVLIQDGDKTVVSAPPTVTTSGNQTLITNSTTVFSTPVAASGETIIGILWTDITGSGSATITSSTSQNTGITGLSVGTHTFRVEVTQSDGQKAHADVTVTLTAPPTANAGTDVTITLPTSSVTLSGSGTVASGQAASYEWTKVSGAGTQTITGNTTLTPSVSGMTTAGDYVFQLKVTQIDGQFALSTVTIHVNGIPPPSQKPVIYFKVPRIVTQIH